MREEGRVELQEKAFRLMEALSGVDEELLARSEEAGSLAGSSGKWGRSYLARSEKWAGKSADNSGKRTRSSRVWRYGKYLAACFAFLALGLSLYSIVWFTYDKSSADSFSGGANSSSSGGFSVTQSCAPADEGEMEFETVDRIEENVEGAGSAGAEGNAAADVSAMSEDNGSPDGAYGRVEAATPPSQQFSTENASVEQSVGAGKDIQLSLEDARALSVVGAYIPGTLPEGYYYVSGAVLRGQEDGGYDIELSFQKTGSGDAVYIVLKITDCCVAKNDAGKVDIQGQIDLLWPEGKDERTFVTAGELTEESFRTSGPVAVIYDSGVVVQYTGAGSPEEICEMFQSLTRHGN